MSLVKWTLFILALLFIVEGASAEVADSITLTAATGTADSWIVANGADATLITVHVTNSTPAVHDMAGAVVSFDLSDSTYGSLTTSSGITNASGYATTIFNVLTKNGNVTITATVTPTVNTSYVQEIDHNAPYYVTFNYNDKVSVNETTPFSGTFTDKYNNLIDDRRVSGRPAEMVHYAIASVDGTAGFYDAGSYPSEIDVPVDRVGQTPTIVKVGTTTGYDTITMNALGLLDEQYPKIQVISHGAPYSMTMDISPLMVPGPSYVPADGTSTFSLRYTLYDQWGNPAGNRSIFLNTTIGEEFIFWSTDLGIIDYVYGPTIATSTSTITATATDNSSVTNSVDVQFINTAPVNLILTANPTTMPSYDARPTFTAKVIGKVIDIKGNPVAGEDVSFALMAVTYDEAYNVTSAPTLLATTATTDVDGQATVLFQPGGFDTHLNLTGYDPTATGRAVIQATWNGTSRNISVAWKNYPYLSPETYVFPQSPVVGTPFEVTIRLSGDGWALQPDPIDVGLIVDNSGSMGPCTAPFTLAKCPATSKMYQAKDAAKAFVDSMNQTRDHIGLVSFNTTSYLQYSLSDQYSKVKDKISTLPASGNTATRHALNTAIDDVYAFGNPDVNAVHAIILMTDGDYNWYGDPMGRGKGLNYVTGIDGDVSQHYYLAGHGGVLNVFNANINTEQNLSIYARNRDIRVYTISFGSGVQSRTQAMMENLSAVTGGKYYHAPDGDTLKDIYIMIAGELIDTAGASTEIVASFENRTVNAVSYAGGNVFEYVPIPTKSTKITWPNGTITYVNQSDQWFIGVPPNPPYTLSFDAGEIKVNEVWEAKFSLKAKMDGDMCVFENSTICFEGSAGPSCLDLPCTPISATPKTNITYFTPGTMIITNLHVTKTGTITDYVPIEWNIIYTGVYNVTETLSYKKIGGEWAQFDTRHITNATVTDSTNLDVNAFSLQAGNYIVKVEAVDDIGLTANATLLTPFEIGSQGQAFIKLE
jgi:hypothetical protein